MTLYCAGCRRYMPEESFALCARNVNRKGRQYRCKRCSNKAARQNYQDNKARYFANAKARDRRLDDLINKRKSRPCEDCGGSYPPYVMDFDHRDPAEKFLKISTMRRRRMRFDLIVGEMDKCDVVCANCHRIRTNRQNPARYSEEHA